MVRSIHRRIFVVVMALFCAAPVGADEPADINIVSNSIKMKFVVIPAGHFFMGSPATDKDALPDEKPQHKVKITKPFLMGQTHVTVGDFRAFVKATGYKTAAEQGGGIWVTVNADGKFVPGRMGQSWSNPGLSISEQHPVCCVDFGDCVEFCKWLSKKEGKKYRLPTEAEWEYACRAGTTTRWSCGDNKDDLVDYANIVYDTFPKYARQNSAKTWLYFSPVAQFKSNPWGLYDMHGNLWQWCSDWYDEEYYSNSPEADPQGPAEGNGHVIRGGTWSRTALDCRSANRFALTGATSLWVGFRVVAELPAPK